MNNLFRRKPIDQLISDVHGNGQGELRRVLTGRNLVMLGVGAIVGAGIFVLSGQVAAMYSGPAILLSFIISGIACAFAGLCYAEFASMIPISGSAYTYAYATLGELVAWIIGWDITLEYLFAGSAISVGWSGYMVSFLHDFGIDIPAALTASTGTHLIHLPVEGWRELTPSIEDLIASQGLDINTFEQTTAIVNLPAVAIITILMVMLIIGVRESATFNAAMVIVKVSAILLFAIVGFAFIKVENWQPFIPENTGSFGEYGWSGIFRGAAVIFFAYIGFDAVSTAAQETRQPSRDLPVGILGSLGVATVLYILVAMVLTGIVSYRFLNVADPIAVAVDAMGEKMFWLRPVIKLAAVAGITSGALVMLMAQPRIFFTMSKDGLLPPILSRVHHRFKTPYVSTIVICILAAIIAGTFSIGMLSELISVGTLLAFCIVCGGVLILRKTEPDAPRPFRVPWVPAIPILGIVICFGQMLFLTKATWIRLIIWMLVGFIIYFGYGRKHSKLNNRPQ
ncbi:MAG: amino acid permease [Salinivirgaceae bacterium]|nr:amino acid permease [Salinivirgaceae bacterium]